MLAFLQLPSTVMQSETSVQCGGLPSPDLERWHVHISQRTNAGRTEVGRTGHGRCCSKQADMSRQSQKVCTIGQAMRSSVFRPTQPLKFASQTHGRRPRGR